MAELLEGVRLEEGLEARMAPAPQPAPGPSDDSWNKVTIWSVAGVLTLAAAVWWIPSLKWKVIVVGLAGLAAGAAYIVRGMNPALFYRRRITMTIGAGFLAAPLDFVLQAGRQSFPETWWLSFDGRLSEWFYPAWAVIVTALIAGDVWLRGRGR